MRTQASTHTLTVRARTPAEVSPASQPWQPRGLLLHEGQPAVWLSARVCVCTGLPRRHSAVLTIASASRKGLGLERSSGSLYTFHCTFYPIHKLCVLHTLVHFLRTKDQSTFKNK